MNPVRNSSPAIAGLETERGIKPRKTFGLLRRKHHFSPPRPFVVLRPGCNGVKSISCEMHDILYHTIKVLFKPLINSNPIFHKFRRNGFTNQSRIVFTHYPLLFVMPEFFNRASRD